MSVKISTTGKAARDAEIFLKKLNSKQKKDAKKIVKNNLREVTLFEKFVETRREKFEIEKTERDRVIQTRALEKREKALENKAKSCSYYSAASELWLQIAELQETLRKQQENIDKNDKKIQSLQRPQNSISKTTETNIKSLESAVESSKARLRILTHLESISTSPQKLKDFIGITKSYSKPEIIINTPTDAWKFGPSEVREKILSNHSTLNEIQKQIENISELLKNPENDQNLQNEIKNLIEKDKQEVENFLKKKLEKSLENIHNMYKADVNSLNEAITSLKQSLAVSNLKNRS